MSRILRDDRGVSVIVGALLLILITVIAAAGLAMIVSQAQKQQMDRQAIEDAVKNEKLNITMISPAFNESGCLNAVNISVQNMNIDSARIMSVSINDVYVLNFSTVDRASGAVEDRVYNISSPLTVPASGNVIIRLNASNETDFTRPVKIANTSFITIRLATSHINYFSRTIKPPSAVMKVDVKSENFGTLQRDYLLLDASGSTSETGQIVSYNWTVEDIACRKNNSYTGAAVRVNPMTSGPFNVNLTVRDENGLVGHAADVNVPSNPSFNPDNDELKVYGIKPGFYPENSSLSSLSFNVQNLRANDSFVSGVSINGISADNYTSNDVVYNYTSPMKVPSLGYVTVNLNSTNFNDTVAGQLQNIYNNSSISVKVTVPGLREFEKAIKPPVSLAKVEVRSESLGSVQRDYLFLDASDSTSETGQIVSYKWKVANGSNPGESYISYGRVVRFNPPSNGPFDVELYVTDDSGLTGKSDPVFIPEDPSFNPPFSLTVAYDKQSKTIVATVLDAAGKALENIVMTFQCIWGDVQVSPISNSSNSSGIATTSVINNGSGTVTVYAGGLSRSVAVN